MEEKDALVPDAVFLLDGARIGAERKAKNLTGWTYYLELVRTI